MAKKKIVITDKPEEAEATTTSPVDETVPEAAQPVPDNEQSSKEPAPVEESQQESDESALEPPQDEPNLNSPRRPRTKRSGRFVVILVLLIAIVGGLYLLLKPTNPLPKADTQLAKFKVYYPKSNSSGYTYAPGSAGFTAGQLTYSLTPKNSHVGAGGPIIRITEQVLSGSGPNLNALTDFTVMKEPAGNAAIGNNGVIVNGVIVTKKTLIILNGIDGATRQNVLQIMKSM